MASKPGLARPSAPIEQPAAYAAGEAWPVVERLVRPIFVFLACPGPPSEKLLTERAPSLPPARPAVWLSADEVALVVGITAHTLRRLARAGKSPGSVAWGQWWFSRADVERLLRID